MASRRHGGTSGGHGPGAPPHRYSRFGGVRWLEGLERDDRGSTVGLPVRGAGDVGFARELNNGPPNGSRTKVPGRLNPHSSSLSFPTRALILAATVAGGRHVSVAPTPISARRARKRGRPVPSPSSKSQVRLAPRAGLRADPVPAGVAVRPDPGHGRGSRRPGGDPAPTEPATTPRTGTRRRPTGPHGRPGAHRDARAGPHGRARPHGRAGPHSGARPATAAGPSADPTPSRPPSRRTCADPSIEPQPDRQPGRRTIAVHRHLRRRHPAPPARRPRRRGRRRRRLDPRPGHVRRRRARPARRSSPTCAPTRASPRRPRPRPRTPRRSPTTRAPRDQWALETIGWTYVFRHRRAAGSAVVALLDTGVDASHARSRRPARRRHLDPRRLLRHDRPQRPRHRGWPGSSPPRPTTARASPASATRACGSCRSPSLAPMASARTATSSRAWCGPFSTAPTSST